MEKCSFSTRIHAASNEKMIRMIWRMKMTSVIHVCQNVLTSFVDYEREMNYHGGRREGLCCCYREARN
jgi:hypothetical protein